MRNLELNVNGEIKKYCIDKNLEGIKLEEIARDIEESSYGIITLGIIKNKLRELSHVVKEDCSIKFLDTTDLDGYRVYARVLNFIFMMACDDLFKDVRVTVEHSLSGGLYCEVHIDRDLNEEDIKNIKCKMKEIITVSYTHLTLPTIGG